MSRPFAHHDIHKAIADQVAAMNQWSPGAKSITYHLPTGGGAGTGGSNPFAWPTYPGSGAAGSGPAPPLAFNDPGSGTTDADRHSAGDMGGGYAGGDPTGDRHGTEVTSRNFGRLVELGSGGAVPGQAVTAVLNAYDSRHPQYNLNATGDPNSGMFSYNPRNTDTYGAGNPYGSQYDRGIGAFGDIGGFGSQYFGPDRGSGGALGENMGNDFTGGSRDHYGAFNPGQGLGGNDTGFGFHFNPGITGGPGYGGFTQGSAGDWGRRGPGGGGGGGSLGGGGGGGGGGVSNLAYAGTASPWDWGGPNFY